MEFPETFDEFADTYGLVDTEEVYTNGSQLIPVFRAKQWLEHIGALSENKRASKHGSWLRMSDLSEDEDDRYKCSQCGNVVRSTNGVNLYTFHSWCGACGSLNNSLLAKYER